MRLLAWFILFFCGLCGIYTISVLALEFREKVKRFLDTKPKVDLREIPKQFRSWLEWKVISSFLLKTCRIDSRQKLDFFLFALGFSLLLVISPLLPGSIIMRLLGILALLLVFYWLAKLLCGNLWGSIIPSVFFYLFGVATFFVYSLLLFKGCLENIKSEYLLTVLTVFIFWLSMHFLRGIVNRFGMCFALVNLLVIYLYNLAIIGFAFGAYYWENNQVFNLFSGFRIYDFGFTAVTTIIFKGLTYFYNFPSLNGITGSSIKTFAPCVEYILGRLYEVYMLAFFISYVVSKENRIRGETPRF